MCYPTEHFTTLEGLKKPIDGFLVLQNLTETSELQNPSHMAFGNEINLYVLGSSYEEKYIFYFIYKQ